MAYIWQNSESPLLSPERGWGEDHAETGLLGLVFDENEVRMVLVERHLPRFIEVGDLNVALGGEPAPVRLAGVPVRLGLPRLVRRLALPSMLLQLLLPLPRSERI